MSSKIKTTRAVLTCCLVFYMVLSHAGSKVTSMAFFGDSLSDNGNTTHLIKSLRQDEDPNYLVYPFEVFVLDKMDEFAARYYVPQMILDAGKLLVAEFFDKELGTLLGNLVSKIRELPIIPDAPYWNYRFSNGRVWNEYLAQMLNLELSNPLQYDNRAFGGSWAVTYDKQLTVWNLIRHPIGTIKDLVNGKLVPPSLGLVTTAYLMVKKNANPKTLYFLFSGGNDYLNVLYFEDNYNPAVMSKYIDNVIEGIESGMKKLVDAGAEHMVIFGVPNIGITPLFLNTHDQQVMSNATQSHNNRLADEVKRWQRENPAVKFSFIDIQAMLQNAMEYPQEYGISNVTQACIDVKIKSLHTPKKRIAEGEPFANNYVLQYAQMMGYRDASFAPGEKNFHVCDNPEDYLFWDAIHPTTKVHKILAYKVCNVLKTNGYELTCPLS
jgi:phospholipase/lecithinase/hemolysin